MTKFKFDKINSVILKSLSEKGKVNFTKIGKSLNLSHVAIKNRYDNLIKSNVIKPTYLVNVSKLGYQLGVLLLEIGKGGLNKILETYSKCPRLIYIFNIIGEYNYCLIFFAEELNTLETMLNSCMLYNLEGVRKSNIMIMGIQNEDLFVPIDFSVLTGNTENTPCGTCCKFCKSFIEEKCIGCPSTNYYRGPLKIE